MCLSSGQTVRGVLTCPHEGEHSAPMKRASLLPYLPADTEASVIEAAKSFRGYAPRLADALGALAFGQIYGWRAVMICYSRSTVKGYEQALGISFRDHMPDRTDVSHRILGVRLADDLGKFWAVVKGEVSVPGGKAYVDDEGQSDLFKPTG